MSQHNGSLKAEVLSRHLITLSRHCMRRAPEEALEFCRDIETNIATKQRMECKKNVATSDNSVATKNKANGRKTLSRQMKREINEDTLKQCRDIKNYRRKKFCHDRSWQIKNASHVKFVTTQILMLRQTFQRMTRSTHEICRDILKLCCDIQFRG